MKKIIQVSVVFENDNGTQVRDEISFSQFMGHVLKFQRDSVYWKNVPKFHKKLNYSTEHLYHD